MRIKGVMVRAIALVFGLCFGVTAYAAVYLPISVSPPKGTKVTAGQTVTLTITSKIKGDMYIRVTDRKNHVTAKRGFPPVQLDIKIPADAKGRQRYTIYSAYYDRKTRTAYISEKQYHLVAKPMPAVTELANPPMDTAPTAGTAAPAPAPVEVPENQGGGDN